MIYYCCTITVLITHRPQNPQCEMNYDRHLFISVVYKSQWLFWCPDGSTSFLLDLCVCLCVDIITLELHVGIQYSLAYPFLAGISLTSLIIGEIQLRS